MIWASLLQDCVRFDSTLNSLKAECDALTDYAVDVRYPDIPALVEEELARKAVDTSDRVCAAIAQRLSNSQ